MTKDKNVDPLLDIRRTADELINNTTRDAVASLEDDAVVRFFKFNIHLVFAHEWLFHDDQFAKIAPTLSPRLAIGLHKLATGSVGLWKWIEGRTSGSSNRVLLDIVIEAPFPLHHWLSITEGIDAIREYVGLPPFLGLVFDGAVVKRKDRSADFGRKSQPLNLVRLLWHAGESGMARQIVFDAIYDGREVGPNALDQLKSVADRVISPLGLEIAASAGVWRLHSLQSDD